VRFGDGALRNGHIVCGGSTYLEKLSRELYLETLFKEKTLWSVLEKKSLVKNRRLIRGARKINNGKAKSTCQLVTYVTNLVRGKKKQPILFVNEKNNIAYGVYKRVGFTKCGSYRIVYYV